MDPHNCKNHSAGNAPHICPRCRKFVNLDLEARDCIVDLRVMALLEAAVRVAFPPAIRLAGANSASRSDLRRPETNKSDFFAQACAVVARWNAENPPNAGLSRVQAETSVV